MKSESNTSSIVSLYGDDDDNIYININIDKDDIFIDHNVTASNRKKIFNIKYFLLNKI